MTILQTKDDKKMITNSDISSNYIYRPVEKTKISVLLGYCVSIAIYGIKRKINGINKSELIN